MRLKITDIANRKYSNLKICLVSAGWQDVTEKRSFQHRAVSMN